MMSESVHPWNFFVMGTYFTNQNLPIFVKPEVGTLFITEDQLCIFFQGLKL